MYERPETSAAINRLWSGLRKALREAGIDEEATYLEGAHSLDHWRDPALLISQTCGMPYRLHLHGHVHLVGSPVSTLCDPHGQYHSVIVAHKDDPRDSFLLFDGATLAVNDAISQSGWAAPENMAREYGFRFESVTLTGGHQASAQLVAAGGAEIAAIDAITWSLIKRFDRWANQLKIIDRTPPTPALPFITARQDLIDPLFDAMSCAIAAMPAPDQDLLCLNGLTQIAGAAYLAVPSPSLP